jgi:membrane fusion protein, type I secretion system
MSQNKWSARRPIILGMIGLAVLVGGFGVWIVTSQIAGAIIASGRIEVDRNRQVVQHLDGGIVSEILVEEGDSVKVGAPLIQLDDNMLSSQLLIVEGQLFEFLARRGRLEAERDGNDQIEFSQVLLDAALERPEVVDLIEGQQRLFFARRDSTAREIEQLEKRRSQIQSQIEGIQAQQVSLDTQLGLIHQELTNQKKLLDKGLAQAGTVLSLLRTVANLEGTLGELVASEASAEGRITELDIEMLKLDTGQREEAITTLRDLQFRELELTEQRRSLKQQMERLDITAPVSGIVYGMSVHTPRSVIRPADPVLYLVPQDRPLVIAARIETIHIDKLFVGQTVVLRFSAFDQRQTPELEGTVKLVSPDAFEDEASRISYYRAEIELNEGEQNKLPEGAVLIPGMPVEAYIRTADRSPLSYFLKPLADYFTKAFREG